VEARPDGRDIAEVLAGIGEMPDGVQRLGARNAVHALRHHDWGHRWHSLLRIAGSAPSPALERRLTGLLTLADQAERAGVCV
jgi:hypothetical protein